MGFDLNIISWVAFAVIVGAIAYLGFRMLRQRLDHLHYQEQMAELEFQETLLANMNNGGLGEDSRFLQSNAVGTARDHSPTITETTSFEKKIDMTPAVAEPKTPLTTNDGPIAADIAADTVMKQLTTAGMVTGIDGYIPLHGNPKGSVLLKLRTGKLALLVPQIESEAFLRHNARRADMIIMVGHNGKAFVVSTMEHFLAENITSL